MEEIKYTMEIKIAVKISVQIQKEIREYLKEEDCNKQYKSYNSLIIDYPYADLITQDNVKDNLEDESEYEELYEKTVEILNSKMDKINIVNKINRHQDDEFDEFEYRVGDYNYNDTLYYAEFDNINDYILELIDLNIKIGAGDANSITARKERDRLIEIILFHKTFVKTIHKLSLESMRYYKTLHNQSSYDCESYELIYKELARDILKKMKPEYKIDNPEAYTYSFLFKKNKFANNSMSPMDCAFTDWVNTTNSKKDILIKGGFLLNENLGARLLTSEEGELNDTYTKALESVAVKKDEHEEIDKIIDLCDEREKESSKDNFEYDYKYNNLYKVYQEVYSVQKFSDNYIHKLEEWQRYLRGNISYLKRMQQVIIGYYYYKNFNFKQISRLTKIDVTNVRRNHKNAIIRLRDIIFNSDFYRSYPDLCYYLL